MDGAIHVVGNDVDIICMSDAILSSIRNVESFNGCMDDVINDWRSARYDIM